MQDETKKPDQPSKGDRDGKVGDLTTKPVTDSDAQSVKGGLASSKFDKK